MMNPLIFYRVRHPAKELSSLPLIQLNKFYDQSKSESEQIVFSVKAAQLGGRRSKDYLSYISKEETKKQFAELMDFRPDDDRQLMKCIDKYISDEIKDKELAEVTASDFDFKKFDLKNDRLKKVSKELLEMRSDLFLKFTKQFIKASEAIDLSGKVKKGSLTYNLLKSKSLALNSAKNKVMETLLDTLSDFGNYKRITINRVKASMFGVEGKVDHEGTQTIFGQAFQQCKQNDPSYSNFRQRDTSSRCWSVTF
mmetsp:Transcript_18316/g.24457  ORF Transcript_18316/g.24457 Transcript_18316/m.24457 type:complete len:253 (-) Transcript_18316:1309-2067(-)